jgi:hypothetical protein
MRQAPVRGRSPTLLVQLDLRQAVDAFTELAGDMRFDRGVPLGGKLRRVIEHFRVVDHDALVSAWRDRAGFDGTTSPC